MIKMILIIGHINYDKFLNNMLEMAKQHPEQMGGMKLPPFTAQMIKMLPARKKNEMVAQALNRSKGKVEPQIEQLLAPITGPIQLKNFDIQCGGKRDADEVTLTVEFAGYDCGYVVDHILPFTIWKQQHRHFWDRNIVARRILHPYKPILRLRIIRKHSSLLQRA